MSDSEKTPGVSLTILNDGNENSSDASDTELDDHFTLSKELLKREKEYIRKNKEIQLKSEQIVKKAELLVKEGKEHLQKPLSHYLIDADENSNDSQSAVISRAAEHFSTATPVKNAIPPKRASSALKSENKKPTSKVEKNSSFTMVSREYIEFLFRNTHFYLKNASDFIKSNKEDSRHRPSSAQAKFNENLKNSSVSHSAIISVPIEDGIGLEATNRLLKAKLVVIQEEMEKVVKNQGVKDTAIAMLEEKLKFFDDERNKISKNMHTLQSQIEKANKANIDLKARNEILETEKNSLKKICEFISKIVQELDGLSKNHKNIENDANSKDLRLNRAIEEVDKLKLALSKANVDSKEKIESLKKNQQSLLAETKKLQKQKMELLTVFKKQNMLIDNLKRQKLHLEAAALLDFSEEEFVRALNCRPMAGKDV
ncbi:Golgin sub A member 2 [Physocladia obscura]|uniref:Golgin sub A member 2 n=1 Tax=Physocladia obscura TaxID=109957 RepID=A0AAD5T362_9FUNG|nr:Golgin sub A member 2 [Physocladia obscura]